MSETKRKLDVVDVLLSANEYRANDLTLPRLLALTHRSAKVDLH